MTQDRPTQYLIKSPEGNYYKDVVDNLVEILQRQQRDDPDQHLTDLSGVIEVSPYDIILIPSLPHLAVSWESKNEIVHTMGKENVTVEIVNDVSVYYYLSELHERIRKDQIRDALWETERILRRNSDLNGLSSKGASIRDSVLQNRVRARGKTYAGGRIRLSVPILIRTRRGVS